MVWFALADVVVGRAGGAAGGVALGGVDNGAGRLGGGVLRKKLISGKDGREFA